MFVNLYDKEWRERVKFIGAAVAAVIVTSWAVYTYKANSSGDTVMKGNNNILIQSAGLSDDQYSEIIEMLTTKSINNIIPQQRDVITQELIAALNNQLGENNQEIQAAKKSLGTGDAKLAIALFDKISSRIQVPLQKLNGQQSNLKYQLGNSYFLDSQFDRAIVAFSMAAQFANNNANLYINRGIAYLIIKSYTQAIADFDKAIEIDPNDAMAYNNRGFLYFMQADYSYAISSLGK